MKLDLVHVPFGGGEPAVEATVGGHTPISFGALAPALPLIKSGGLRALAVTGKERAPTLPDVPTMAEAGLPRSGGRDLDRGGGAGGDAEGHRRQAATA